MTAIDPRRACSESAPASAARRSLRLTLNPKSRAIGAKATPPPGRARAGTTRARPAGALLPPGLGATAGNHPATLGSARTLARGCQLGPYGLVKQMGLSLDGEYRLAQ